MPYVKANFKCEIEVQTFGIFQIYSFIYHSHFKEYFKAHGITLRARTVHPR